MSEAAYSTLPRFPFIICSPISWPQQIGQMQIVECCHKTFAIGRPIHLPVETWIGADR